MTTSQMTDGVTSAEGEGIERADVARALEGILRLLGVTRMYVVDDNYSPELSMDDVSFAVGQGAISLAGFAEKHPEHSWLAGIELRPPLEQSQVLSEKWGDLSREEHDELRALVGSENSVAENDEVPERDKGSFRKADEAAILGMREFFPDFVSVEELSATQWLEQRDAILSDTSAGTLIFFDLDLKRNDLGSEGGLDFIDDVVRRKLPRTIFGLFTHRAQGAETEIALAREFRDRVDVTLAVMGKDRADRPDRFIEGLRVYLVMDVISRETAAIAGALSEAVTAAQLEIQDLDPYSFITAVEASRHEGVFDLDGPLRIANRSLRREMLHKLHSASEKESIAKLRAGADLHLEGSTLPKPSDLEQRRWNDIYDDYGFVNEHNLPLEVGDVFAVTLPDGEDAYYVLLAQPCDLTVRKKGQRTNSTDAFALARLREAADDSPGDRPPVASPESVSAVAWEVNLAETIYVPAMILDSTVFNADGRAVMSTEALTQPMLLESWSARGALLEKQRKSFLTQSIKALGAVAPKHREQMKHLLQAYDDRIVGLPPSRIHATIDHETHTVTFNVRRTVRLLEPAANQILTYAGQRHYRPAGNFDLFRESAS